MILILSDKGDQHADRVESILKKNAAEYSRLNLDIDSVKAIHISSEENSFRIDTPNCSFSTSQIDAVWNRSAYAEKFMGNRQPSGRTNQLWNKKLTGLFSSLESTKWLNLYHDFYGENQFSQFAISKNIGLKWPSSICTNDINFLNSFFETKKDRIVELMDQGCQKDCTGKCSERLVIQEPELYSDDYCPFNEAAYKVRCSVVGKEYFVGRINAILDKSGELIDANTKKYREIHPPKSIKLKAIQLMTELDLTHGVFDFIVTEEGEWFFDSLNPVGQYQWVEDIRGTDISSSIAKWLMMNN